MMSRAKSIEKRQEAAVTEKSKLLKNLESCDHLKITQLDYYANRLLSLKDVSIYYGGRTACQNVSFAVERGDRIALCGETAPVSQASLKLICGEDMTYTGTFEKGSRLLVSYVPQDTSFLSGDLSGYARNNGIDESLFKAILRKLDFSRLQFEKDMRDYSGGQKKKVLIAASLCRKAHLLVWDEPLISSTSFPACRSNRFCWSTGRRLFSWNTTAPFAQTLPQRLCNCNGTSAYCY
jgi:lincosamide and streptogramin A transport system ATP-binding/permease protein